MRPHRHRAHQAPRTSDSPGKNTGVGCHFLLQCMKVKSVSEVTQSCLTHGQLSGLIFPVSDPRTGVTNRWLLCFGRVPKLMVFPFSPGFLGGNVGLDQIASPPFLPDSMWVFLYRLGYRRAILLVPRLFLMTVVICANCSFSCVSKRR